MRSWALLLVSGTLLALPGCFLFGGGDDEEKDKGAMTSQMADGGPGTGNPVGNAPPSPWRSIELREEESSSGGLLPIVAIVLSILSLGLVVVHWILHGRRRRASA